MSYFNKKGNKKEKKIIKRERKEIDYMKRRKRKRKKKKREKDKKKKNRD